jgi:hypothetical protein
MVTHNVCTGESFSAPSLKLVAGGGVVPPVSSSKSTVNVAGWKFKGSLIPGTNSGKTQLSGTGRNSLPIRNIYISLSSQKILSMFTVGRITAV